MSLYSNVSDETVDQIALILGGEEGVMIIDAIRSVKEITVEEILTILSTFDRFRVLSSLHFFLENGILELRT